MPFQLGTVLNAGLLRVDSVLKKYQKEFDCAEKARQRFLKLQQDDDQSKRARTGPYAR